MTQISSLSCRMALLSIVFTYLPFIARSEPPKAALSPIRGSFIYCHKHTVHGFELFAGAPLNRGALQFGLSIWDSRGFHLGLWGMAFPSGQGWEYRDQMSAADPNARCDILIRRGTDNSLTLTSVGSAVCGGMTYGGSGMDIEDLRFDSSTLEGPVTWQLQDGDTFFNHAGRCSGG